MGLSTGEALRPGECGNFLGTGGEGNKMFTQFSMTGILPADKALNLDSFNWRAKPSPKNSFWKLKPDNFSLELDNTCSRQAAPSLGSPPRTWGIYSLSLRTSQNSCVLVGIQYKIRACSGDSRVLSSSLWSKGSSLLQPQQIYKSTS